MVEIRVKHLVLQDSHFLILTSSVDWTWIQDITKGQFDLEKKVFLRVVKNANNWMMTAKYHPKTKWMELLETTDLDYPLLKQLRKSFRRAHSIQD